MKITIQDLQMGGRYLALGFIALAGACIVIDGSRRARAIRRARREEEDRIRDFAIASRVNLTPFERGGLYDREEVEEEMRKSMEAVTGGQQA